MELKNKFKLELIVLILISFAVTVKSAFAITFDGHHGR
jgi:hypothetical protein